MGKCSVRNDCFQEQQRKTFTPFPLKPMEEILFQINADHSRLVSIISSGERIGLDESDEKRVIGDDLHDQREG